MKRSSQWKALEREAAAELKGRRVHRGANFAVGAVDVELEDLPSLKVDAKYKTRHAHHSLLEEVRRKYCAEASDIPVLVTKSHHQRGANATVPLWFLGLLLDVYRAHLKRAPQSTDQEVIK
jgi:hypothetical protein